MDTPDLEEPIKTATWLALKHVKSFIDQKAVYSNKWCNLTRDKPFNTVRNENEHCLHVVYPVGCVIVIVKDVNPELIVLVK